MEIKEIKLTKVNSEGSLKAIASINFEDLFVVHSIRLIEGKDGLFLSFPAVIREGGKYFDIAHPISSDFRTKLTESIIAEYNKEENNTEKSTKDAEVEVEEKE